MVPTELVRSRILDGKSFRMFCIIASWQGRAISYEDFRLWGVGRADTVSKARQRLELLNLIAVKKGHSLPPHPEKSKYWVRPRSKWKLQKDHLAQIEGAIVGGRCFAKHKAVFKNWTGTAPIIGAVPVQKVKTNKEREIKEIKKKVGMKILMKLGLQKRLELLEVVFRTRDLLSGGSYLQDIPKYGISAVAAHGADAIRVIAEVLDQSPVFFDEKGDRIRARIKGMLLGNSQKSEIDIVEAR
jgi:hypothetical protein